MQGKIYNYEKGVAGGGGGGRKMVIMCGIAPNPSIPQSLVHTRETPLGHRDLKTAILMFLRLDYCDLGQFCSTYANLDLLSCP